MLISMRTWKWGQIDMLFSPDEDMRKIERKMLPYGKVLLVNYTSGVIEIQPLDDTADYVHRCIRRMRFKKPAPAASPQEGEGR